MTENKITNVEQSIPKNKANSITIIQAVEKAKTELDSIEELRSTSIKLKNKIPKKFKLRSEKAPAIRPYTSLISVTAAEVDISVALQNII
jgi:hypothetical protein